MSSVIIPESQVQNAVNLRDLRGQLLDLELKANELKRKIELQVTMAFRNIPGCSFHFNERPSRLTGDPAIDNVPSDDPHIIVYSYRNFYLLRDGSGWGTEDPNDKYAILIPIPRSRWPMTPEAFKEKVLKDTAHLELKVMFYTMDVRQCGGIENINALKLLHHDKIVEPVQRGEVWYVGWDISDPWYTATIDGFLWAFWHEGGHGGDIDKSAKAGTPEWERFQEFLKRDGT